MRVYHRNFAILLLNMPVLRRLSLCHQFSLIHWYILCQLSVCVAPGTLRHLIHSRQRRCSHHWVQYTVPKQSWYHIDRLIIISYQDFLDKYVVECLLTDREISIVTSNKIRTDFPPLMSHSVHVRCVSHCEVHYHGRSWGPCSLNFTIPLLFPVEVHFRLNCLHFSILLAVPSLAHVYAHQHKCI